ncbi:hypothetical protein E1301_Tti012565 [Triplophysa tibetana]|uniref:Uncharacterized protein n=1 Tax=Triplophysa tibetana TaxID=1572043 RepID=A0A5A9NM29_9TELE|nr:hypothetical protein E1301_Tti012565 [Triplophysa tibetana]
MLQTNNSLKDEKTQSGKQKRETKRGHLQEIFRTTSRGESGRSRTFSFPLFSDLEGSLKMCLSQMFRQKVFACCSLIHCHTGHSMTTTIPVFSQGIKAQENFEISLWQEKKPSVGVLTLYGQMVSVQQCETFDLHCIQRKRPDLIKGCEEIECGWQGSSAKSISANCDALMQSATVPYHQHYVASTICGSCQLVSPQDEHSTSHLQDPLTPEFSPGTNNTSLDLVRGGVALVSPCASAEEMAKAMLNYGKRSAVLCKVPVAAGGCYHRAVNDASAFPGSAARDEVQMVETHPSPERAALLQTGAYTAVHWSFTDTFSSWKYT